MIASEVLVIGAGFAGLGAAAYLRGRGRDVRVLERADTIGGTWRDNVYPGCACDIPPALYSYSFAPQHPRSRGTQPEILDHLGALADRHGLREHIVCGAAATDCRWDEAAGRWHVTTDDSTRHEARFLVLATGALNIPRTPRLDGTFDGTVVHTARWDDSLDVTGRRVAVVGTGASAVQVVPHLASVARHVTVVQRTAPWILPRRKPIRLPRKLSRVAEYWRGESFVPALTGSSRRLETRALRHLHDQVPDPRLRAALTPDHTTGCKRILFSDTYYPALGRSNVDLVTAAATGLTPDAIVTADGREHPVDVIVHATGFHVSGALASLPVTGRDGTRLLDVWARNGAQAHLGTTVAGFPNAFVLGGPNTGLAHNSVLTMTEAQIRYVGAALDAVDRAGARSCEVTAEAEQAFADEMVRRSEGTVWTSDGCRSWYLDHRGVNRSLWPDYSWRYMLRTRRFDRGNYEFSHS
ncbi:flavin-containing monooxygenase [Rhodococcus yananensis]|uniref:flavin-containing monooxygenase n=1 Tax=Rhodococcus yananensis TaxID=2879464 RepID=UPI003EBC4B9E